LKLQKILLFTVYCASKIFISNEKENLARALLEILFTIFQFQIFSSISLLSLYLDVGELLMPLTKSLCYLTKTNQTNLNYLINMILSLTEEESALSAPPIKQTASVQWAPIENHKREDEIRCSG
jgi:hypothetical protein